MHVQILLDITVILMKFRVGGAYGTDWSLNLLGMGVGW